MVVKSSAVMLRIRDLTDNCNASYFLFPQCLRPGTLRYHITIVIDSLRLSKFPTTTHRLQISWFAISAIACFTSVPAKNALQKKASHPGFNVLHPGFQKLHLSFKVLRLSFHFSHLSFQELYCSSYLLHLTFPVLHYSSLVLHCSSHARRNLSLRRTVSKSPDIPLFPFLSFTHEPRLPNLPSEPTLLSYVSGCEMGRCIYPAGI